MTRTIASETLGFVLNDAARLMRAAFGETIGAAGLGVTAGEARALMHVAALDLPRQAAVAERMGIEPMTLSGYLDRLEAHGLVRRDTDPCDRRANIVTLTARGEAMVESIRQMTRRLTQEITAPLGEDGGERLRDMLVRLRDILQERRNG